MKILITGSNGFFGQNAVKYFTNKGYIVTEWTEDVRNNLPNETYDVLIPFACKIGGRKGMDNNALTVAGNIEIDRAQFLWAESKVGKIIYPGSSSVYPAHLCLQENTPMQEDAAGTAIPSDDIYGLYNYFAERMLAHVRIPVSIVRPVNVYGPGQSLHYPMPSIIQRTKNKECSVWGSGRQTRDWIHIHDVMRIFEYLMNATENIIVNAGCGKAISFIELAETVYKVIHGHIVPVITDPSQPEGPSHRVADVSRLAELGLMPTISIEEGIKSII
jgi:nucleoside-diphosphate-sugar epimerase